MIITGHWTRARWLAALSAAGLSLALLAGPTRAQDDSVEPAPAAEADAAEADAADADSATDAADMDLSETDRATPPGDWGDADGADGPPSRRGGFREGFRGRGEGRSFGEFRRGGGDFSGSRRADGDDSPDVAPDGTPLLALSFRDMSMENVARFISEKTGKPVIPHQTIKDRRITIVSAEKLPLPAVMRTLREALLLSGVIMEEHELLISLRPAEQAAHSNLPLLSPDDPLAEVKDPAAVVRKVFDIRHYDPAKLQEAIVPMLPEFGSVVTDPNTRKLVVTDTVAGLARIEQVIRTLDVPAAGETVRKIIPLQTADATWVVSIIKLTIGGEPAAGSGQSITVGRGSGAQTPRASSDRFRRRGRGNEPASSTPAQGEVMAIQSAHGPVILVPEVTRNWIIAVAPAQAMAQIEAWVEQLDQPENVQDGFQMYDIRYADINEVASQIAQVIEATPNLAESVRVVPFSQSGKLLVFGSRRGQRLVAGLLEKLDAEDAGSEVMKVIALQYADAETVAANIQELFSSQFVQSQSRWSTSYGRDPNATQVKVTADIRRNTITVVTNAATLAKIEALITEQWDKPIDASEVQPKVYRLQHADPVQVRDLLTSLFSESSDSAGAFSFFYGGGGGTDASPVGRLFGQFSFQSLPDSNQLVVTTKNAENYKVIDELIADLDQPQEAGLPQMIELKHANAEDLAEQVNAALAEPGTLAEILRTERDLSRENYSSGIAEFINNSRGGGGGGGGGGQTQRTQEGQVNPDAMRFWWQQSQPDPTAQPTSNLIGKVRVVPVARRNALLVLAPEAYRAPIMAMIEDLDRPGSQVIIRAVIAEVQHDDTTTLGIRLASDPAALSDAALSDQAIGGGANLDFNELFAEPFEIGSENFARGIFNANLNLNVLLQLLIREFGLKILTEPKLYTADNEEAQFFDGRDVSIQTLAQTTNEGTLNRSFTYVPIGTQLRVRPHITKEGDVSLRINLVLSSISPGATTFGNPIFDRRETSTHVIVRDGQTIMLSGIVRQEEFRDVRKIPLLGDVPLLGGLFRSTDTGVRNRELIIFITPEVVANTPQATEEAMIPYREKLEELRSQLRQQPDIVKEPVLEEDIKAEKQKP